MKTLYDREPEPMRALPPVNSVSKAGAYLASYALRRKSSFTHRMRVKRASCGAGVRLTASPNQPHGLFRMSLTLCDSKCVNVVKVPQHGRKKSSDASMMPVAAGQHSKPSQHTACPTANPRFAMIWRGQIPQLCWTRADVSTSPFAC